MCVVVRTVQLGRKELAVVNTTKSSVSRPNSAGPNYSESDGG